MADLCPECGAYWECDHKEAQPRSLGHTLEEWDAEIALDFLEPIPRRFTIPDDLLERVDREADPEDTFRGLKDYITGGKNGKGLLE